MSNLTPSTIAYDVLRNKQQYALVQEILTHESDDGYPYLRQVVALYYVQNSDTKINPTDLLVDSP
jgi:hypothetical protein